MKKLIFICGPNGVGKTTACRELLHRLDNSAYVDPEWCSAYNPFVHTEETKKLSKSAMLFLLSNYIKSHTFQNIIWNYGFHGHRKETFDDIMNQLSSLPVEFKFVPIILECGIAENINRMVTDKRDAARIQRAIENTRELYDNYDYTRINVTHLSVKETVDQILNLVSVCDKSFG